MNVIKVALIALFVGLCALAQADVSSIKYQKDGHLYTTYVVARLAGLSVERATELSWGSQVPDDKYRFSATLGFFYVHNLKYRKRIMSVLHSLHGGIGQAVEKRREDLKQLLRRGLATENIPDWKSGLIIHAFADSYSHTKIENGIEVAFDSGVGHLFEGHGPDLIANDKEKYLSYVSALYYCFTGETPSEADLKKLLEAVDTLTTDKSEAIRKMHRLAASLGMPDDFNNDERDHWMDEIDKEDVKSAIALMEESF